MDIFQQMAWRNGISESMKPSKGYQPQRGDYRVQQQEKDVFLVWVWRDDAWEFVCKMTDAQISENMMDYQPLDDQGDGYDYWRP